MPNLPLHVDDVLFFAQISDDMRRVAKNYGLPLRKITAASMPSKGMIDFKGRCFGNGDIELVLRCTENGEWCPSPRTPSEVRETAAHELAHLRHMNHGIGHQEFTQELAAALRNEEADHTAKVIDKLVKLQKSRESEAAIGNTAAAEAFAGMINKMLIENELNPSDIDYARATDKDPVIEVRVNQEQYGIKKLQMRMAWQESLARVVAKAHLCTFLIHPRSNSITFVGTRSHALVAEYAYGILVPAAKEMSLKEGRAFLRKCQKEGDSSKASGFGPSWLDAFVHRIAERFDEARKAAVAIAVQDAPGTKSVALMRLDGALIKVQKYIDDKFSGRRSVNPVYGVRTNHAVGRAMGRAAADAMAIGRKGISSGGAVKGLLGGK
jgi:hypothetical protein